MRRPLYRIALGAVYAAALGVVAYFAARGLPYYLTPIAERPRHADYWLLKPGGTLGVRFGIAGALLMVVMHVYTARKKVKVLASLGPLRAWLDFHILCGIVGPLLITLHTSLKVGGLVAVAFWSMVVVALSGLVGRYLYSQIPRRRSGAALGLSELEEMSADTARRLQSEVGLGPGALRRLDEIAATGLDGDPSLLRLLLRLPLDGLRLRWRLRAFRAGFRSLPRSAMKELAALARQRAQIQRRIRMLEKLQELFHYWHVVHRPFAIVMYLFVSVHVGVVLMTGYGWLR